MKVGTDSLLLGSWVYLHKAQRILDVGTGTGVLALMVAQRSDAAVLAIDVDMDCVTQAAENVARSQWKDRVVVEHISIQRLSKIAVQKFDAVVANPPYFFQSSKPSSDVRTIARHADETLPHDDLASAAAGLLGESGSLFLVLPKQESRVFAATAASHGLFMVRFCRVFTKITDKVEKRQLLQYTLQRPSVTVEERLTVMEPRYVAALGKVTNVYSDQYRTLTQEFHHPKFLQY